MTLQAHLDVDSPAHAGAVAVAIECIVHRDLAASRTAWTTLEPKAVVTPYQRYDWVAAVCAAGFHDGATIRIVEIRQAGTPIAILPVAIVPWMGAARGQVIGADMSNGDSLVVDRARAAAVTPAVIRSALEAIRADGTPLDLMLFASFPRVWQGIENPLLALPHTVAPNTFYRIDLPAGQGGSFIDESFPHKRRTNIKRSIRRLEEQFGALSLRRATTPEAVAVVHAAFLEQRAKRFRQMGVVNIFARETFRRLFIDGAVAGLSDPQPAICMHALYAGDTIVATSIGTIANGHYSQYINSTTDGPAAKYTLMGVMMSMLVDELRATGVRSLDMGLGEFDYKTDWTEPEPVYDSVIAISARGRAMAKAVSVARRLKREIKTNPLAWRAARAVLAVKSKLVRP